MKAKILDGKALSKRLKEEMKREVELLSKNGEKPGLAVIIVEGDAASRIYVNNKKKACFETGIYSEEYALPNNVTENELISLIDSLNNNPDIDGILVQLPLPKHIDEEKIIMSINPKKDVDAFHPVNTGKIMIGNYDYLPCTPAGVMELIHESGIDISGKDAVVIGRSNIVGKPMAMLLMHENATVTVCHSKTRDLTKKVKNADIVVAAIGKANFVTSDMIKEGAVVIDVGINRTENGLKGDVDFESVSDIASAITPVPGGVGPMTIAMLMRNTITAFKLRDIK